MNHHTRLLAVYWSALVERTWKNKASYLRHYRHFCDTHGISVLFPIVYDLLSFLLYLSTVLKSPGVVFNYFSTVKLWVTSCSGDSSAFSAHEMMVSSSLHHM